MKVVVNCTNRTEVPCTKETDTLWYKKTKRRMELLIKKGVREHAEEKRSRRYTTLQDPRRDLRKMKRYI